MIRPYSRDLINDHKPIMELNYNSNIIIIVIIIIEQNGKFNNKKKKFLLEILEILALYIQQVNQQTFLWVVIQKISLIRFLIQF